MLKNITASEIRRMTTDGKTVENRQHIKINRQHFERLNRQQEIIRKKDSSAKFLFFTLGMDSDPRLVVFFMNPLDQSKDASNDELF